MINRVVSIVAAIAALVEGLANPGSAVPSRVQPYLVLAGSTLIAVERVLVFLESKPDPRAAALTSLHEITSLLPSLFHHAAATPVADPPPVTGAPVTPAQSTSGLPFPTSQ